jgi:hypothetical protein
LLKRNSEDRSASAWHLSGPLRLYGWERRILPGKVLLAGMVLMNQ